MTAIDSWTRDHTGVTSTSDTGYPFSAIVGNEQLQLALILCAVRPQIGGVLVRGEKGTAKTTAVRGLSRILSQVDGGRLVELPVGATEDRVIGSVDLARVLRDGEHAFSPGLLARADGGVLYVDEVNLLPDHLVDVLLDAAATGWVHIERDGVSHSHRARFTLVGTMNPEEGELRPQLLDRFGLTVDVRASRQSAIRASVVRRRMAYESDPETFAATYADADTAIAQRIAAARSLADRVILSDAHLDRIASVCAAFDVDGLRADIVMARTAIAHAAWRGAGEVDTEDIRAAAELALPHRGRRDPFDEPELDPRRLDDALNECADPPDGDPANPADGDPDLDPPPGGRPEPPPNAGPTGTSARQGTGQPPPDRSPVATFRTRALTVPGVGNGDPGRRSRGRNRSGAIMTSCNDISDGHGVHLFATVLAAATRRGAVGPPRPHAEDLRGAVRVGREANLVVFVVDASGSMAARDRITAVRGATLSLLRDAYQRRDKLAVIAFRQDHARVLLPPTSSAHIAHRRLSTFETGGQTPLAEGLLAARDMVRRERVRDPARRPLIVVLTDGRATGGPDPVGRSGAAARTLACENVASVVVDCETSYIRLGLAATLAGDLRAPAVQLEYLRAEALARAVRDAA